MFRTGTLLLASLSCWLGSLAHAADFTELDRQLRAGELGSIKSLLIAQNGEVVFEGYYRGTQANTLHLLNSVSKSLGATLVGIAHRQQRLRLEEPVSALLPQYDWNGDPALRTHRALTLAQILTMRTGIAWDEWSTDYRDPNNSVAAMLASSDWYRHVLTRPAAQPAGTHYTYNSGVSTLMSGILRARTGLSPQAFAQRELFAPLGIEQFHIEGWSAQGMGFGMTRFPFGDAPLGFAWWLTARDLLKLGELYRNDGVVNGQRLLDHEWIAASWARYSHQGNSTVWTTPDGGYGYQWWLTRMPDARGRSFEVAYADGWGRQYLLIFPELDLTIASTAEDYDYDGPGMGYALRNLILDQFDPVLDARFSGSWYDPQKVGQGLNLEILEDRQEAVVYWYTYTTSGQQQWLYGQGPITDGQAELTLYRPSGGQFLQSEPPADIVPVGQASLRFSDCQHGELRFQLDGADGEYPIQRLTGRCDSGAIGGRVP